MSWSQAVTAAGVFFELIGLWIAVRGVADLKAELFPGRRTPWGRVVSWVNRFVFRRQPTSEVVSGSIATDFGGAESARGQNVPQKPETFEPSEAWIRYLVDSVRNLSELRDRDARANRERFGRVEQRIAEQGEELREAITSTEALIRTVVGGEDGSGLDKTWWGLVLAGVGATLQGSAALWL